MSKRFRTLMAAAYGSELHDLAHKLIKLKQKLPSSQKTLNMYVNDAIGFRMESEVILYYSPNAFGTADSISFRPNRKTGRPILRIHDLKTGTTKTSVNQLEVYAAYFCLEYGVKPGEIDMEFRIYQNDMGMVWEGDPIVVTQIMSKIVEFDNLIEDLKEEEYS